MYPIKYVYKLHIKHLINEKENETERGRERQKEREESEIINEKQTNKILSVTTEDVYKHNMV